MLGHFVTVDDAGRGYDAEVRRRGWAHVRPLNFPQPEEVAAYARAGAPCDERGLPLSLEPVQPAAIQAERCRLTPGCPGADSAWFPC